MRTIRTLLLSAVAALAIFAGSDSAEALETGEVQATAVSGGVVCEGTNCARWVAAEVGANPDFGWILTHAANHGFGWLIGVTCDVSGVQSGLYFGSGDENNQVTWAVAECPSGEDVEATGYLIDVSP